ncbi:rhomboid family intramembrane serine protease [Pseudofulvibacter geojedonensis]|uniref:Rhomboid family intramembrane serine protease n=1 Tax=Pseudofulvibacter geojedonensis TaxID=1123758 RepID=A0ABW3I3C0_9FLAO
MIRITNTVKHLVIINVVVFLGTQLLKSRGIYLDNYLALFFIKNDLFMPWQFFTTMFMHADFQHLLFNMLGLWMFGSALEQMWGKNKFLFFYFSAGIGASLIYTLANYLQFQPVYNDLITAGLTDLNVNNILETGNYDRSILKYVSEKSLTNFYYIYNTPAVGASGAIMGVLVAFGMLFPNSQLMLLFPPIPVKAKYLISFLVIIDLIGGFTGGFSLFGRGNVAHWAHLGGAIIGFIMMLYWKKNQFNDKRWN